MLDGRLTGAAGSSLQRGLLRGSGRAGGAFPASGLASGNALLVGPICAVFRSGCAADDCPWAQGGGNTGGFGGGGRGSPAHLVLVLVPTPGLVLERLVQKSLELGPTTEVLFPSGAGVGNGSALSVAPSAQFASRHRIDWTTSLNSTGKGEGDESGMRVIKREVKRKRKMNKGNGNCVMLTWLFTTALSCEDVGLSGEESIRLTRREEKEVAKAPVPNVTGDAQCVKARERPVAQSLGCSVSDSVAVRVRHEDRIQGSCRVIRVAPSASRHRIDWTTSLNSTGFLRCCVPIFLCGGAAVSLSFWVVLLASSSF